MKVYKSATIKEWYEKTDTENQDSNTMTDVDDTNPNIEPENQDSSELFDNNTHFMVPPFFCEDILFDKHREIPLKYAKLMPAKQKTPVTENPPAIEDPELVSKIQNSTATVLPADMFEAEFLEVESSSSSDSEPGENDPGENEPGQNEPAENESGENGPKKTTPIVFVPIHTNEIKIPTMKRRSYCDWCDYDCARAHTLVNHQKKHHPEDFAEMRKNKKALPFKPKPQQSIFGKFDTRMCCVECDCVFKTVGTLHTHQKRRHPEFRKTVKIKKAREIRETWRY